MKVITHIVTLLLAIVLWQQALYVSNESVTVGWDPVEEASYYEGRVVWQGSTGDRETYLLGSTTAAQMEVVRPRAGAFEFGVRACNDSAECSDWARSTDPEHAQVDGVPKGWRILFELPGPIDGGVT